MSNVIRKICVNPFSTIREAMVAIDTGLMQIALVVDSDRRVLGTVTDGDVRRGLLSGFSLNTNVLEVMRSNPTVLLYSAGRSAARRLMRERRLHHIPLVDDDGRVVDIAWVDEIVGLNTNSTRVVLMAGGLGMRLRPLTEQTPKSMLPIGDQPLLEIIIRSLIDQGFGRFTLSVNYLSEIIRAHFGDGSSLGIEIDYIDEKERMGTAGALSLIEEWPESPFIVMNGDLLTTLRFDRMMKFHVDSNSIATMGAREFKMQIPYGVLSAEGTRLTGIEEKPNQTFYVNAGIYILSPNVADFIEPHMPIDMPEIFQRAMSSGDKACVYPIHDYWTDIGRVEDLERARLEYKTVFSG
jgi:dTDP-glucose pyrophosphorylase/CBS domain-containing protein